MAFYIADFGVHAISIADTATPVLCGFFFFFFFFFLFRAMCATIPNCCQPQLQPDSSHRILP